MPLKSRAQEAFLAIHHPDVLRKWKSEGYSLRTRGLPGHVRGAANRGMAAKLRGYSAV